jgi:hypothetical protein
MWRYFAFRNHVSAWILSDEDRDVGYLAASPEPDDRELWVNEWSAPSVANERVLATLRAFAEREGLPAVAGWLRPDHAGPPFHPARRDAGTPMIALLDPVWATAPLDPSRVHFGSFEYL